MDGSNSGEEIKSLGLSLRATNALLRNDIDNLEKLKETAIIDLFEMRGIGRTCIAEIAQVINQLNDPSYHPEEDELPSLSEYFHANINIDGTHARNYRIFAEYYNKYPSTTLESIANEEDITRERVRQIIKKTLAKAVSLVRSGKVKGDFINVIKQYAQSITRIDSIDIACDGELNGITLAHIAMAVNPHGIEILNLQGVLNDRWLVTDADKIKESINELKEYLFSNAMPIEISDLAAQFSLSKAIILNIRGVSYEDGMVSTNGNGLKRIQAETAIFDYLEEVRRPASVEEVAKHTDLSEDQVRRRIGNSNDFINVGQSLFALVNADYSDQSVVDMIKGYLIGLGRPATIKKVVWYVQQYKKNITGGLIEDVISERIMLFEKTSNGTQVWLRGVKRKDFQKHAQFFEIHIEDAVLWIFQKSDDYLTKKDVQQIIQEKFGDRTTNNLTSVYNAMIKYANLELLRRVGDYNSGLYARARNFDERIAGDYELKQKIERVEHAISAVDRNENDLSKIHSDGEQMSLLDDNGQLSVDFETPKSHGWKEDIVTCIDEIDKNEFTTEDVYKYIDKLKQLHPSNDNIEAKIRQQLQVLRNEGRLIFTTRGSYRKRKLDQIL